MNKPIAIIAGEPNSISSEIIFKSWKLRKKYTHKPLLVIGSIKLLNLQKKKLNYRIKIKEIKNKFSLKDLNTNMLSVYDVEYKQTKPFQKISNKSNRYIFKCFNIALDLAKSKKILGFINCPVSKETLFKKKQSGVTEFLSKKSGVKDGEVMLIYNKKLSVSPLTTHIPINQVSKKINQLKIIKKIKVINNFYRKILNKKPHIAVLGLNPHNFTSQKSNEEKKIIIPAIKKIKKTGIKITGPISPDTSFVEYKKNKFDVIFGMYHDQVLAPYKTLFKYNAINITLGLPFIRVSPDHGTAINLVGKKISDPTSLNESVKFFNCLK